MKKLFIASIFIFATALLTFAQTSRGIVSGVVADATGAVVPGTTVVLKSTDTSVARSSVTNDDGFYRFDAVILGNYTITISAENFGTVTKTGIIVNANQTSSVNAQLEAGTQQVSVDVTAEAGAELQRESSVRGGNITPQQITQLPISGNPVALALTLPGVSSNRGGFGVGTFSVNGARGRSNNFLIDGTENNDISVAGQGFQIVNRDSVQEVSVQTSNFDAEFGRAGGAVINVITKSGTTDFHGTLSFLYDSSADDAITAAASRLPKIVERGRPASSTQIIPSATFSGPLFFPNFGEGGPIFNTSRDKNFFFVAYLEDRFRQPGGSTILVTPTAAGRAVLSQFASNPNVARYLALTANAVAPVANRTAQSLDPTNTTIPVRGAVQIGEYSREFSNQSTTKEFQFRTDHKLTENDQLTFRFLKNKTDSPLSTVNFPGFDSNQTNNYYNFLIAETHVFSPSMTNEFRIAYNRIDLGFPLADPSGLASTLPTTAIAGLTSVGAPTNIPQGRVANNYQVQDTITKIFGDHTIRTGVDYLRQISTQLAPADNRGTLTYASTSAYSALANFVDDFGGSNGSINRVFGSPVYNPTLHRIAAFAQDRWRFSNSLTLSMGLRYENFGTPFNTLSTPAFTGLFNVDPETRKGPYSEPNAVASDDNNFAPSLGFAYSPTFTSGIRGFLFGEGKSVIRGGYNIGYDSFFNNIASNAAASSPNQIVTTVNSLTSTTAPRGAANFSTLFPTTAGPILPTSAQTLIASDLVNPYYQRWSLGMQRELPFKTVVDISYVGSKGTGLYINEDLNPLVRPELRSAIPAGYPLACTPGGRVTAAQATARFPLNSTCPLSNRLDNLQGGRTVRTNGGDSNYHAAQVEVRRRFADNFQVSGAYTFSKLISNQDEVFGIGIGSNTSFSAIPTIFGGGRNERAVSSFDRTHKASFTYVIESPFFKSQNGLVGKILGGYQLSGITTFESGVPYTVFNGFDADGIGGGLDRPTYNPNGQKGVRAIPIVNAQGVITGYFNPEIVLTRNAAGVPLTFAPIDPNTAEFIVNPAYLAGSGNAPIIGNLGRNTERSLGTNTTDITLLKRVRFGEKIAFEGRGELFNALNTPQFSAGPSTANALTQGLFLQGINPTTSGGGRVVRYQVKFLF